MQSVPSLLELHSYNAAGILRIMRWQCRNYTRGPEKVCLWIAKKVPVCWCSNQYLNEVPDICTLRWLWTVFKNNFLRVVIRPNKYKTQPAYIFINIVRFVCQIQIIWMIYPYSTSAFQGMGICFNIVLGTRVDHVQALKSHLTRIRGVHVRMSVNNWSDRLHPGQLYCWGPGELQRAAH